jgi:integrase
MLTDKALKSAKPQDKQYRLPDHSGMYALVMPNGGKYFRLDYSFNGKRNTMSLGTYPDTTLLEARTAALEIKAKLKKGLPAKAAKEPEEPKDTLKAIANDWLTNKCEDKSQRPQRMLNYILPWLGDKVIDEIKPRDILARLSIVQDRGTIHSASKALQIYGQVWRYAVATGRAERDITQDLKGALQTHKTKHFSAITEPKQFAGLLRAIDSYNGQYSTQCALKLAPLLFQRPGELRAMRWQDIDFEKSEWRYLVTKTETQHIVPLSTQALAILKDLFCLTGDGVYCFPGERSQTRPISENTLGGALKRLGFGSEEMTSHGFRAAARTMLDEVLGYAPHLIEHQLAHNVKDPLGRSYNRTKHLTERKEMMQAWADYLDTLKNS